MENYVILENLPISRHAAASNGATPLSVSPETRIVSERLPPAAASALLRDPRVAAVAQVFPTRLVRPFAPVAATGRDGSWAMAAIGADRSGFDGAGTAVALLDTGIDASHDAFQGIDISVANFSGSPNEDVVGHGTHCAGTIVGRDVKGVRIGVARGVGRLLVAKVMNDDGGGETDMAYRGIQWAVDSGADVLNLSLGLDFPGLVARLVAAGWPPELATSSALEAFQQNLRMIDAIMAMLRARSAQGGGALIVAAAGNESRRDVHPEFRIGVALPAAGFDVIAVAALEDGKTGLAVAPFSNRGPTLSAPGSMILSAALGGGVTHLSGTSMAAPHVAGAAALWFQQLRSVGLRPSADLVAAKLKAAAASGSIIAPHGPDDIGVGMVQCP